MIKDFCFRILVWRLICGGCASKACYFELEGFATNRLVMMHLRMGAQVWGCFADLTGGTFGEGDYLALR